MPKFRIELEDGRKFEIDAEDQASALQAVPHLDKYHEAAQARLKQNADLYGPLDDYKRKFTQGQTLGWHDDAQAYARAGLGTLMHPGSPTGFNERLKYEKAFEEERLKQANQNTGALGTAAELAGGLATGGGAARAGLSLLKGGMSLPKLAALGSAEGAGYGAVAGGGEGEGFDDKLNKAFKGGITGAALGAGIPVVGAAVGAAAAKPMSRILSALDPNTAMAARLAEDLKASGKTIDEVMQQVKDANAAGIPLTVADAIGKEGQRRLYTAAGANGPGREFATKFLNERQEGQMGRVTNLVEQALGADRTARQAGQQFMDQARTRSKPLYDAIPEYPQTITPRVEAFLKEPIMQQALKDGVQIQRNNALASGEDLSFHTLPALHEVGPDAFNFRHFQAMKIGLDNMLEKFRNPNTGQLELTAEGRSILNLRKALDEDLKNMFDNYAAADAAYSGPASVDQAIGLGKQLASSGRSIDNIETFNALNDAQKVGARIGYADKKLGSFRNATEGANVSNRLLAPEIRAELEAMSNFSGPVQPGASPELTRRLRLEKTMNETRNMALGGSRTAENLADQANNGVDPRLMSALGSIFKGKFGDALASGNEFVSTYAGGNTPALREEIAKAYLSTGDKNLAALLRRANNQAGRIKKRYDTGVRGLLSGAAAGSGLIQ